MKRILYVFALFLASTLASEAQRIEISTLNIPSGKYINVPAETNHSAFAPVLPGMVYKSTSGIPANLLAAPEPSSIVTMTDESDSAFVLTSRTNPENRTLTAIYDFPLDLTQALGYKIMAPAQFVPGLNGTFIIDTVAFTMFKLTANPDLTQPMLMFIVATDANLNANNFAGLNQPFDNLEILGSTAGYDILPDTVNTRLVGNDLRRVIITLDQPVTVPPGKSFGFVIYPLSDNIEQFRMFGGRQWDLAPNKTYGSFLRRRNGNDTISTSFSALRYQNTIAAEYPSLANKQVQVNYDFVIVGTLDVEMSVEPISNEAGFKLEQNTPNPVNGDAAIEF
ncbi:MAG TPA: hypothetical protein VEC36_09250, partial [Patescibacteria group bacterium]|nr:hypothetical protein [Patescibacteria group bacterium]